MKSILFFFKILTSPLHQTWLVDLYGNLKLTIQLAIEGKKTNLTLNTAASVSFATFGGVYVVEKRFSVYDYEKRLLKHCSP